MKAAVIALAFFLATFPDIARSTPTLGPKAEKALVGYWRWRTADDIVQILADGSAKSRSATGAWRERSTGITLQTFEIQWNGSGGVDVATLDGDGRKLTITSSRGDKFTAERMDALRTQ